jgi:hypothetical protein
VLSASGAIGYDPGGVNQRERSMVATLTIRDETTGGARSEKIELQFPSETITVREIIRERVYQEVQDYNRRKGEMFRGLVQPSGSEVALNGYRIARGREVDWKQQFEQACAAYASNRILVLAGDHQTESLDETITITRGVEVTFLKLTPLVGG